MLCVQRHCCNDTGDLLSASFVTYIVWQCTFVFLFADSIHNYEYRMGECGYLVEAIITALCFSVVVGLLLPCALYVAYNARGKLIPSQWRYILIGIHATFLMYLVVHAIVLEVKKCGSHWQDAALDMFVTFYAAILCQFLFCVAACACVRC